MSAYRPQLDPWPSDTAPGPLSPAWREPPRPDLTPWPEISGPDTPPAVLELLCRKLEALRAECYAVCRNRDAFPVTPIGRSDVDALNRTLAAVKTLNAALSHHRRSRTVAAWPAPVLPTSVLLAPRDLLRVLDSAILVVAGAIDEANTWWRRNG
jgi:hypothetical protein